MFNLQINCNNCFNRNKVKWSSTSIAVRFIKVAVLAVTSTAVLMLVF